MAGDICWVGNFRVSVQLSKGQNAPLPDDAPVVQVHVDQPAATGLSLDLCALTVDVDRQILSDAHFVFYNQPASPDGAVSLTQTAGQHTMTVQVPALEVQADTVVIVGSLTDQAGTPVPFSRVGALRISIRAENSAEPLFVFEPDRLASETALIFAEIYRRGGAWKVRAVGQGYDTGLAGIAREFGVDLDDPPEPAAPAVRSPAPPGPAGPAAELGAPGQHERPPVPTGPVTVPAQVAPAPLPARPAAEAPPPPPPSVPASSSEPTLWLAAKVWHQVLEANQRVVDLFHRTFTDATAALGAAEPSISAPFREATRVEHSLLSALREVYGAEPGNPDGSRFHGPLDEWAADAESLAAEVRDTRVPLTRSKRDAQKWAFTRRAGDLLRGRRGAELETLQRHYREAVRASDTAFQRVLDDRQLDLEAALTAVPTLPAVVDSLALTDLIASPITPGPGPLLVRVGSLTPGTATVHGRQPIQDDYRSESEATRTLLIDQPWSLPALVDLNMKAGIVTTDPRVVNNTLLRLVSLLPAGQFKMTLFDPVRLGDSARFIFGLGDAADTIIGDKVRSTDRELAETLLQLEEHLTFVTQKYLQGQYETLGDYNEAAGEVAEPYRALVLYDYPHGFVRPGGQIDDELVARLRKIVGAGQRCGVVTFIVRTDAKLEPNDPASKLLPLVPTLPFDHWLARHLAAGTAGNHVPTELMALVPGYQHSGLVQAASNPGVLYSRQVEATWTFRADPEPAPEVVSELLAGVERGLVQASDVRVSLQQVAELAASKHERDVARGTRGPETLPHPTDPNTWWHSSAAEGVSGAFGRIGAKDIATLDLDSQIASGALVGGRMGSGKSVLLHAIILSLATRYSPEELSLYLIDFKEGVEFKAYATHALPHARVVAVESEREFGLSVLQSLDSEITRRGALFRESDGQQLNLAQYRHRTGQPLPRIVLLIDEFHVLFNQDDKIGSASADLLDRIIRQGRAFGVHVLLASQTLTGISTALNKATLGLIPIRLALQSSDADSRVLLADDNADARLLTRPGEGIHNTKGGLKDGNARFQAAFTSPEERAYLLHQLRTKADARGLTARPVVFEGKEPASVDEAPLDAFTPALSTGVTTVPIGLPLTLDPVVTAPLRREPGGNLLLVMSDDAAYGTLTLAAASLLRNGASVHLLDYGPLDAPWERHLPHLSGQGLTLHRRHTASSALADLDRLVQERHDLNDLTAPTQALIIASLHRARDFDTSSSDGPEVDQLEHILREGPDVGIHVIAWCDKPVSINRRLTSSMQREFSLRLLGPMSKDDSFSLIDNDIAAFLNHSQLVLDDHDQVRTIRARRFALPDPARLATLLLNS
jgi:stress response protein SCP2